MAYYSGKRSGPSAGAYWAGVFSSNLRAMNAEGKYLHMNGQEFTGDVFWAWKGSANQFKAQNEIHGGILIPVNVNARTEFMSSKAAAEE